MYVGKYVERKVLIFSLIIGLLITLATSLLINNTIIGEFPNIRIVSIPLMGVSYWGYPLPWMKQVVYPNAVKEAIWFHFVLNVAYWTGLVLIVKVLYLRTVGVRTVKEEIAKKAKLVGKIRPTKLPKRPTKLPTKRPIKKPARKAKKPKRRPRRRPRRI